MDSDCIKPEGEGASNSTVDEVMEDHSTDDTTGKVTSFGPDELRAAMASAGMGMDHLRSVQHRVWNSIAHGSTFQKEAEVYITLVTLKQFIHDNQLDNSLLGVLEQSDHTFKDMEFKTGTQDQTLKTTPAEYLSLVSSPYLAYQPGWVPTKTNLPEVPDELIVKIIKTLFWSSEREDLKLGDGVHVFRPKDHAILRTCHRLKDIGMQHYHESTAVFINHRERETSAPVNWAGRTFMSPSMIVSGLEETKGIYYVLDRFPELEHLELDFLPSIENEEQATFAIELPVSWDKLKSDPVRLFTSRRHNICVICTNRQDQCPRFNLVIDICQRLRSKISKVDLKFRMCCSNVKCLTHPGIVHNFEADYILKFKGSGTFTQSHSIHMIGESEWDLSEKLFGRDPNLGDRPDCQCEAQFQE